MWSEVSYLRKQHNGRSLNPGPPDPEFEVLNTPPHTPPQSSSHILLHATSYNAGYKT